jgi:hypothetical protein
MSHPNLSDDINRKLTQSEIEGGIWLTMPEESATIAYREAKEKGNVLAVGKTLLVQTKNTLYRIEKRGEKDFWISGHPKYCPEPREANIHGSTWGGSMLKMGWVGRGMRLEFNLEPWDGHTITTSEIQEITEAP